jgi:hypothetical protein
MISAGVISDQFFRWSSKSRIDPSFPLGITGGAGRGKAATGGCQLKIVGGTCGRFEKSGFGLPDMSPGSDAETLSGAEKRMGWVDPCALADKTVPIAATMSNNDFNISERKFIFNLSA